MYLSIQSNIKRLALMLIPVVVFVLASCKKENKAKPEMIELTVFRGNDTAYVLPPGLNAATVTAADEKIATAQLEAGTVRIKGQALGSTEIRVRDARGVDRAVLQVWVGRGYPWVEVKSHEFQVEAQDPVVKKQIEDELRASVALPVGGGFGFFGMSEEPRMAFVFPQGEEGERIEGSAFVNKAEQMLIVRFSNKEYRFIFSRNVPYLGMKEGPKVSDLPPSDLYLTEDFSTSYRERYPDAGVTKALRTMVLR